MSTVFVSAFAEDRFVHRFSDLWWKHLELDSWRDFNNNTRHSIYMNLSRHYETDLTHLSFTKLTIEGMVSRETLTLHGSSKVLLKTFQIRTKSASASSRHILHLHWCWNWSAEMHLWWDQCWRINTRWFSSLCKWCQFAVHVLRVDEDVRLFSLRGVVSYCMVMVKYNG